MDPDSKSPTGADGTSQSESSFTELERDECQELFLKLRPQLLSFAIAILKNAEDGEEAVQMLGLKMPRLIRQYDRTKPALPYLIVNLRYDALEVGRRNKAKARDRNFQPRALAKSSDAGRSLDIDEALNKLTPEDRKIVKMRFRDDLTLKEIAKALGMSDASAKWRYRKILGALRRHLRPFSPGEG